MPKILFVGGRKNEAPFVNEMRKGLEAGGYEVAAAYDDEEGLAMARRVAPDVIVLDIKTADGAGRTMFKEFRLDERIKHVPIILCTDKALPEGEAERGPLSGAGAYLKKPLTAELLIETVEDLSDRPFPAHEAPSGAGHRKNPRLKKDILIDFKLVNAPGDYQMANCVDISEDGVQIETVLRGDPPAKGTYLEMVFRETFSGRTIKVFGEIARVERNKFSLDVKFGLRLIFLKDGDAVRLKKLIGQ